MARHMEYICNSNITISNNDNTIIISGSWKWNTSNQMLPERDKHAKTSTIINSRLKGIWSYF